MSEGISVRTRKRLWLRSDDLCAFEGCTSGLLEDAIGDDTIIGVECHIVAQKDAPDKVARTASSLTPQERIEFKHLIDDRHEFDNLVLMCGNHSTAIDAVNGGYSVANVVEMKRSHETERSSRRSADSVAQQALVLRNAEIVDGWVERSRLDEWRRWVGNVFGDGHPRLTDDDYTRLADLREWIFSRAWPGTAPCVEAAMENFRRVAQDLQQVISTYPWEHGLTMGWRAPTRFYNDPQWTRTHKHARLDDLYDWIAFLLEDLALELTRAANLVCEAVRQELDTRFRVEEGLVVLESGPYGDFKFRLHRSRYDASSGWTPYDGLADFVSSRENRDEHRGAGDIPAEFEKIRSLG